MAVDRDQRVHPRVAARPARVRRLKHHQEVGARSVGTQEPGEQLRRRRRALREACARDQLTSRLGDRVGDR